MHKNRPVAYRCLLFILIIMILNGCASNIVSIDSRDQVIFTALETSFPVSDDKEKRIKIRLSQTSGDFSQNVPDTKAIEIEGNIINGPTTVDGTTDLIYGSVAFGVEKLFNEKNPLGMGFLYIGAAFTNLDLTLSHQGNTYGTNETTAALYCQLGLSFEIIPSLGAGITLAPILGTDLTTGKELEMRINYRPYKHLECMGGYRWLQFVHDVRDGSDIEIHFRGPFIGLNVPF